MVKKYQKIYSAIVNALSKYGPQGHRRLRGIIQSKEYLNQVVADTIFRKHLHGMINIGILTELDTEVKWKQGKRKLVGLSAETKEEIRLKTFIIDSDKRSKRLSRIANKRDLRRKAYQILLHYGIVIPQFPGYTNSITDISHSLYGSGFPFSHLKIIFADKKLIRQSIKLLEKEKLARVIEQSDGKELLSVDDCIKKFLLDAWNIFEGLVIPACMNTWKFIRNRSKDEREWYESIYGKEMADKHFIKLKEELRDFKSQADRSVRLQRTKERRKHLVSANYAIVYNIQNLKLKYNDVIDKHKSLFDFLINEIIYPQCLRDSNPVGGGGKPKVLFATGRDTVILNSK